MTEDKIENQKQETKHKTEEAKPRRDFSKLYDKYYKLLLLCH